jgi:CxxC motif-containing protein
MAIAKVMYTIKIATIASGCQIACHIATEVHVTNARIATCPNGSLGDFAALRIANLDPGQ